MDGKRILVRIADPQGVFFAEREVIDFDPVFYLALDDPDYQLITRHLGLIQSQPGTYTRGPEIRFYDPNRLEGAIDQLYRGCKIKIPNEQSLRNVVSVTNNVTADIEILAPLQVKTSTGNEKYCIDVKKGIELRPGAQIIGGRHSGFYDSFGIILQAEYTGGSTEKWEDWAYKILTRGHIGQLTTFWILISGVGGAVSEPKEITRFNTFEDSSLDELLKNGEHDLFDYFVKNPNKLSSIHPKQFEELVSSVYKNLGFDVEPVGAWNQADGGIDIKAISRSFSGFEYKLAIQCKVSKNKISARPIRELAGVISHNKIHQGIVATTSNFTDSAIKEHEGHFWNISLLDKEKLMDKMVWLLIEEDQRNRIS